MTRQQQKERAAMRLREYWARKNRKPTNADRIRAMTDEELAVLCEDGCPPRWVCPDISVLRYSPPTRQCLVCGEKEDKEAWLVDTGIAWLCPDCKRKLLKLIQEAECEE